MPDRYCTKPVAFLRLVHHAGGYPAACEALSLHRSSISARDVEAGRLRTCYEMAAAHLMDGAKPTLSAQVEELFRGAMALLDQGKADQASQYLRSAARLIDKTT